MKIIGITGDSGVGKSTITLRLSEKLNCPFLTISSNFGLRVVSYLLKYIFIGVFSATIFVL